MLRKILYPAVLASVLVLLLAPGAPAWASDATGQTGTPFARGTRWVSASIGASRDADIGSIRAGQFGVDSYLRDNLAVHVGLTLAYADPKTQPNGIYGGPQAGLRWHVVVRPDWSAYLDGLVAPVLHEHSLTAQSLRFNFDLEGGAGVTRRLGATTHLAGGLRWQHLSNARVRGKSRNLGYDAPQAYLGVLRHF